MESSLKVLVLATTFPRWEDDTVPNFVYELSKELQKNGLEVVVLAPHDQGAQRKETMSGITVYRYPYFFPSKYQKLCFEGNGGILATLQSSILAWIQIPFFLISLLAHAMWLVRKEDIDVTHSHWATPNGVAAGILRTLFDVPHVMTLHTGGVLGLKNLPLNSHLINYIYKNADKIVPVSTHIRDDFTDLLRLDEGYNDGKFSVQPMGAHVSDFSSLCEETLRDERNLGGKVVGLYVGNLSERKGVKDLLSAYEKLDGYEEQFHLTLVGAGPLEEDLYRYVEEIDAENIEVTGWVSNEELHERYALSDFLIVPSIETDWGDTEGMPTVISEGFAAGNPVVASDVGGISDVVDDQTNGYLVSQQRPDELAKKIESLINDRKTRDEMSRNASETAEELDWDSCGETYTEVIRMVA